MNVFTPKTLDAIARVVSLAWWIYFVVILSLFFGGLVLNYIAKKINEARLENRFSLRNKGAANQSTQVIRPMEIDNRSTMPMGHIAGPLAKGISLVFNKEDNLLEDKRRKEDTAKNAAKLDYAVITVKSTDNIDEETSSAMSANDEEMNKSVFLGNIYKELYEKRAAIEKANSLTNADRDSILSEIIDRMVCKINESKSTPSIKKLIDIQNEDDIKDWALDLIKKKINDYPSTSGCK